jgi:hypothetical protein
MKIKKPHSENEALQHSKVVNQFQLIVQAFSLPPPVLGEIFSGHPTNKLHLSFHYQWFEE